MQDFTEYQTVSRDEIKIKMKSKIFLRVIIIRYISITEIHSTANYPLPGDKVKYFLS